MIRLHRREALKLGLAAGLLPDVATARPAPDASPLLHGLGPRDDAPWHLPQSDPSRLLLDDGWRFHEGDIDVPSPVGHHLTYLSVKAGNARGPAAIDWDDGDWPMVRLPHDWASAQPFVQTANVSQGYRPRGIGWYRRTFRLDPVDRDKRLELHFGGIATQATIWINGSVVARNFSAYNAIIIDITPFARFGEEDNVVAIRVDANAMEGWWYEGAGLYRHAWLARRPAVSIATDGVHCDPRQEDGTWRVPVTLTVESIARDPRSMRVTAVLRDPAGQEVARQQAMLDIPSLKQASVALTIPVAAPHLWSVADPALYSVDISLDGPDGSDRRIIPIGFRTIAFDADRGVLLNGTPVKLKGVCLHLDHAGVGVAVPDALLAWRLARLKDMGCNAIRCSHNAQADEFYVLCDQMGFLVMDENRIFNPAPENLAQLEWLVRAHRNHPSIILWSVFNEEPMQGTRAGVEMVRRMRAAVRELDDSRPVTAAMNGSFYDPDNVSQVVDVMGFNYYPNDYDRFHVLNPRQPITSSEDTSAFMTRGAYASDARAHVSASMDEEAADWGATHRKAWKAIAERPFVAGGFVWTGFDYHGEPTPYEWPTIASFFGILDLCGFAKTAYDIRRAQWMDDRAVVGVAPHWTWPGREGQPIDLLVTSNAPRVRVRVNGRIVADQPCDRIMGVAVRTSYEPGLLEVEALRDGQVVARAAHHSAGPAVALRLTPTRAHLRGDGEDVLAITIDAIDARGHHVPVAQNLAHFTVTGATLIGVGNGDPNCHESEKAPERSLFNGLAQMIVQAGTGRGQIRVEAQADGLRPSRLILPQLAVPMRASVAALPPRTLVGDWRRSPVFADRPDPALRPADGDNNLWAFVRAGTPTPADIAPQWRIYRAALPQRKAIIARGGKISFAALAGQVELWVDGRQLVSRSKTTSGPLVADLPSGARDLVLLVRSDAGQLSGLLGRVQVEARD
ncbi:Beta-galactosidase [Sphingobium indicum BiD32]|uniref:Beta-galactosidase n=1 Tax=Sphingobium indicum BiD32 TaxID=1301087 RepID=N1MRB1_9SPHN|nr:beta-galactosidase GalA [Sphingobium indicum]CCW19264.1 Beta-galactosidase [Sphingobium indicum BiD32]